MRNSNTNLQYIRDEAGKPLFVILPMAEYEKLADVDEFGFPYDDETETDLIDVEYEAADNDNATIPHGVVKAKFESSVNLLGAWRIYRGLSQQEVAEKLGISQGAISQMEQPDNKPQKKTLEKFSKIYGCEVEQMY